MAVRSTPAHRPAAGDSVDLFYPLTREQLLVPAIPRVRLSLADNQASAEDAPPPHSIDNTLASRSRGAAPARPTTPHSHRQPSPTARPEQITRSPSTDEQTSREPRLHQRIDAGQMGREPVGHLVPPQSNAVPAGPDVRFVSRAEASGSPSLAEMAAAAFPPGKLPWDINSAATPNQPPTRSSAWFAGDLDLATSVAAATRLSRTVPANYPYWLVALIQILVGTMLVIMVVRFANSKRESAASPPPAAALDSAAATPPNGNAADSAAGLRITWFGRQPSANQATNSGIFEF